MRCKPGDLAVVAYMTNENVRPFLGRIVKCVRIVDNYCWVTVPKLGPNRAVYDGALRPIRPTDGDDETLTWAGKPEKAEA